MYNIIMDTLRFEWDPNKNEINKKKHGLSFEAAKEVFYDEFAILFDDPDHSIEEDRFLIIGSIKSQKIATVTTKTASVLSRQGRQPKPSNAFILMEFEVIV